VEEEKEGNKLYAQKAKKTGRRITVFGIQLYRKDDKTSDQHFKAPSAYNRTLAKIHTTKPHGKAPSREKKEIHAKKVARGRSVEPSSTGRREYKTVNRGKGGQLKEGEYLLRQGEFGN